MKDTYKKMFAVLFIMFGIVIFLPQHVDASTSVGGTVQASTTWTLAGSPYLLTNQVIIPSAVTLTIEPGVVVKKSHDAQFINDVAISVEGGTLNAAGTPEERIKMEDLVIGGSGTTTVLNLSYIDLYRLAMLGFVDTLTLSHATLAHVAATICNSASIESIVVIGPFMNAFGGKCNITIRDSRFVQTNPNLNVMFFSDLAQGNLSNVIIEGASTVGIRIERNGRLTADHIIVKDSNNCIRVDHGPSDIFYNERLSLTNSEIMHCTYGVYFAGFYSHVAASGNSIHDNTYGVFSEPSGTLTQNFASNWWGDPSGPYNPAIRPEALGDFASTKLTVIPWLTSQPFPSSYTPLPPPDTNSDPEPEPEPTNPDPLPDEDPEPVPTEDDEPDIPDAQPEIPAKTPVVIVPGIMATEMADTEGMLWINLERMLTDIGDEFMDGLAFGEDLRPLHDTQIQEVIDRKTLDVNLGQAVTLLDYSYSLIKDFENEGYIQNSDLFLFSYDWRYGADEATVDNLQKKIEDIQTQTGSSEVNIVAHSMGGLIVKKYVMEHPTDNHVGKAIFVGVPNIGSPQGIKTLIQGSSFGMPFLAAGEIKKLARNFPSVYDLAPSQSYYGRKGSYFRVVDRDILSSVKKSLTYAETNDILLGEHGMNTTAVEHAEALHAASFDDYDMRAAGVDIYNISGCKAGTLGEITETRFASSIGFSNRYHVSKEIPGDGTVPLESAMNLPGDTAKKYYSLKGDHTKMLSQNGIRQMIVNILSGRELSVDQALVTQDISKCQLNGRAISIFSPLSIDIVDQDGNHAGISSDGVSTENNIPNADYQILGEHKFVYLPTDEGQEYSITVKGTGMGVFTLTDGVMKDNTIIQTMVFDAIPVTSNLKGRVVIGDPTKLLLDTDGDGIIDETLEPDHILSPEELEDFDLMHIEIPLPPIEADPDPVVNFPPPTHFSPAPSPVLLVTSQEELPKNEVKNPDPENTEPPTETATTTNTNQEFIPSPEASEAVSLEKESLISNEAILPAAGIESGFSIGPLGIVGAIIAACGLALLGKKSIKK